MSEINKGNKIEWNFDNSYTRLPKLFFTRQDPTPVKEPRIIVFNKGLAEYLNLDSDKLQSSEGVEIFSGNKIPEGAEPIAEAYAGHQFGHFTMLGDGRAVLLGEQVTSLGERFDIQLKGSGITPYSRGGDGRAALGPMLREYIISEAMNNLGIPTTRSLAVVTTGEEIVRETIQPGAILTRVASSHLRVGTFEYASSFGSVDDIRILANYTLQRHFQKIENAENPYLFLLKEVIKRQASLIAKWQLVGFIHGVMNTDNMAISGETIDYGPCAFMDNYNPATVFSSIDRRGRYAYENQPRIGAWNLARFAETLIPLLDENEEKATEIAQHEISNFTEICQKNWMAGMRTKLGIFNEENNDETLFEELLSLMHKNAADYTNTFKALTLNELSGMKLFETDEFTKWYNKWQERLGRQMQTQNSAYGLMKSSNPAVIPRNHRVEEALEAAVNKGDYSVMEKLLKVLSSPFEYSQEQKEYCTLPETSDLPYKTFCGT